MHKTFAAAILAIMLPVAANACNMAYASCRHNDSRTDTNRSDTPKPKQAKPAYGWPGLHVESVGGMRVVVDSRISGGVGVIVAYDNNGHLKVRDRTGRIFVLTDPSKRAAPKPHVRTTLARSLRSAPATDVPTSMADDRNQQTTVHTDGSSASPTESDDAGQTGSAADGGVNEAGAGASDQTPAANGDAGASSAPTEAAAH
ncbi:MULTISPECIES: hypothetical protein [unclassified Rhizobium]|jgi:hypothetical protein|uniref:hypothetical protein n=1 Tax=Rhizobium sp. BG4 TaxID=2613770 RepID=UPI00193D9B9C|nr:hypothetical protein [Rhizobium sp. BG4]QRM47572.1 hypothetical protein F2982_30275 [Rhizobium sp. BG4]